jgi:hypothetical protein
MNSSYFAHRLACLASEKVQVRYGLGGTAEEYILAMELLEDAHDCVRLARSNVQVSGTLTELARTEILALEPLLSLGREVQLDQLAWAELLCHPLWQHLRDRAKLAITALDFDLQAWEESEL